MSQLHLTLGLGSKTSQFITVPAHRQFIAESYTDTFLQLTPTKIDAKRPKTLSVKIHTCVSVSVNTVYLSHS